MMKPTRWAAFGLILLLILGFWYFDLFSLLSLAQVKAQLETYRQFSSDNQALAIALYFLVYVTVTALSLPGAAVMTLLGGALFGVVVGSLVVSFASTLGAVLAFWTSRFLLQDWVQSKWSSTLQRVEQGLANDGALFVLSLRLVPAFPFFLVNLILGLTRLATWKFALFSQLGMLPGTVAYVNAGTQLSQIDSLQGLISPEVLLSLVVLAVLPWIAKFALQIWNLRKLYAPYRRPSSFDYNMVVIGGGSAGLVSAYIGSAIKAKVALIEKHRMGGDCLNTGCVPSKALIRSSRFVADVNRFREFGMKSAETQVDFPAVMERIRKIIARIEPNDSMERYRSLGVDCIEGSAKILSPYEVQVGDRKLTTKNIVVATGARPRVPDLPGLRDIPFLTSDTVWELKELPPRLLVLGGGAIGCELSQAFAFLGSKVTLVERAPQILGREDQDVAGALTDSLRSSGVEIRTGVEALQFEKTFHGISVKFSDNKEPSLFTHVLLSLGRVANTTGFGLEELGVLNESKQIDVDPYLRTKFPNIFACGDVVGPYQFTHMASHQAWFVAVNALFRPWWKYPVDYRVVPWATYTTPEIARVGWSESEARAQNLEVQVFKYDLHHLDRGITDGADHGFVKVLTKKGSDRILGATIVAEHASEMLPEFVLAMKHRLGLNKILSTIHAYPTMNEANKFVAGVWRRETAPQGALAWLARFHRWNR